MCDRTTVRIPLRRRGKDPLWAVIDLSDLELALEYNWWANPNGCTTYGITFVRGEDGAKRGLFLHNHLMGATGVDHKNGDGLDNRRENLRFATPRQNAQNMAGRRGSSSRYKGVGWHKSRKCWQAYIKVDGQQRWLGQFLDEEAAAKAYDSAAVAAFGEFARLNFPDEVA